ncbi:hypothetical protein [Streptosporangium sp. G12]
MGAAEEPASTRQMASNATLPRASASVRATLDSQGIAYAQIRFVPTATSAALQVFLSTPDNVGDWGRISRYVPTPNRAPPAARARTASDSRLEAGSGACPCSATGRRLQPCPRESP